MDTLKLIKVAGLGALLAGATATAGVAVGTAVAIGLGKASVSASVKVAAVALGAAAGAGAEFAKGRRTGAAVGPPILASVVQEALVV